MGETLSVRQIRVQTVDAWHQIASERIVALSFTPTEDRFRATFAQTVLSEDVSMHDLSTTGLIVDRSEKSAAADPHEDVLFVLQRRSSGVLAQNGRDVHLTPGSLALFDPSCAYSFDHSAGNQRQLTLRMSRRRLGVDDRTIARLSATPIPGDHPESVLVQAYMRALWKRGAAASRDVASASGDLAIELIGSLLSSLLSSRMEAPRASEYERMIRYIDAHFERHDLDVAALADAHHVSVRNVYNVFARRRETPAAAIRARRLQHAAQLLHDHPRSTLVDIAIRSGFGDAATFARAFRRQFGHSPSTWRREPPARRATST